MLGLTIVVRQALASWPSEQPTVTMGNPGFGVQRGGTTLAYASLRPGRMRIRPTSRSKS